MFRGVGALWACFSLVAGALAQGRDGEVPTPHFHEEDAGCVIGYDGRGVPIRCGTGLQETAQLFAEGGGSFQQWEVVPSVLRADSREGFYIYVCPNRAVEAVRLVLPSSDVVKPENLDFNDDGSNGDAVKGDGVYSLGPFFLNENQAEVTSRPITLSPGYIQVVDASGSRSTFTIEPTIGVLPARFEGSSVFTLGDGAQMTRKLLNVKRSRLGFQEMLRGVSFEESQKYVRQVYAYVQDEYDEMFLMSSGKLELFAGRVGSNQNGGIHMGVQSQAIYDVSYDHSRLFGSEGVLESVSVLDYQQRGMNPNNMMHEFLHRWGAYLSLSLGFKNNTGHYDPFSNADSLLGGSKWLARENGSFVRINGGWVSKASSVDLFSMGLLPVDELPDLHLSREIGFLGQETVLQASDIVKTITAADVRAAHASRMPDWENPKTHFRVLFVIESRDRLLTKDEMAYYSGFVEESMRELEESEPDPVMGGEWAPVSRFFGDRVSFDASVKIKASLFEEGVDHDYDGYESRVEALLGLDPFDAGSKPWMRMEIATSGEAIVEVYPYEAGGLVELQQSKDLVEWTRMEEGETTKELLRVRLGESGGRFFRTRIDAPESSGEVTGTEPMSGGGEAL